MSTESLKCHKYRDAHQSLHQEFTIIFPIHVYAMEKTTAKFTLYYWLALQYVWNYAREITSDEQFSTFVRHMESCREENKISQLKKTVWYVMLSLISCFTILYQVNAC